MHTLDDRELLQEYVVRNSEEAFAELVARHVNLVYSVALRHAGNSHAAEEITQAVFVVLARKAASLRPGTVLAGWLFHAARLTASNYLKKEIRRTRREQEAYMRSSLQPTDVDDGWKQVAPLLDGAIASLGKTDRDAIVLRFMEGKDLKEVGVALGASEEAAKKRVSRAVEKLRRFFAKRGVVLSGTALTAAITVHSAQAAPAGLAAASTAIAVLKGATASGSIQALIQGTLKIMAWAKMKVAIGIGAALLLAIGGGIALREAQARPERDAVTFFKSLWNAPPPDGVIECVFGPTSGPLPATRTNRAGEVVQTRVPFNGEFIRDGRSMLAASSSRPVDQGFQAQSGFQAVALSPREAWEISGNGQIEYHPERAEGLASDPVAMTVASLRAITEMPRMLTLGIDVKWGSMTWNGNSFKGTEETYGRGRRQPRQIEGNLEVSNNLPVGLTCMVGAVPFEVHYEYSNALAFPFPSRIIVENYVTNGQGQRVLIGGESFEVTAFRRSVTDEDRQKFDPDHWLKGATR